MHRSNHRARRLGAALAVAALATATTLLAAPTAFADTTAVPSGITCRKPGHDRKDCPGGKTPEQPGTPPEQPGTPPARDCTLPPTITGTAGADVLVGTFGQDVIDSLGGNDVVRGEADFGGVAMGDADVICLRDGDDVADGGPGGDYIDGGIGNDVLDGDNFPDPGADTLIGGEGNDTFTGGMGDDSISGGPGNDIIDPPGAGIGAPPASGADTVDGGEGDDVITEQLDGGVDTVDGGPGNDRCVGDVTDTFVNCETVIRVPAGG